MRIYISVCVCVCSAAEAAAAAKEEEKRRAREEKAKQRERAEAKAAAADRERNAAAAAAAAEKAAADAEIPPPSSISDGSASAHGDESPLEKVKRLVGGLITKPKMSDKHLKRPPFRFLVDIVMAISKATGYLEGAFNAEEMGCATTKDLALKARFISRWASVVQAHRRTPEDLTAVVDSKNVLSGAVDKVNFTHLLLSETA
jgi:hypothetical protein